MGHLVCAQEAWAQLGLERVTLVPVGEAPHRVIEDDPGADVRFSLCERAVAGDERLAASRVELDRDGPSYTADTLRSLREQAPEDELTVILGADQAAALGEWHDPGEVLSLARVAVASRGGVERDAVLDRLEGLAGAATIEFFAMPRLDVSSTSVRERAASGRPIRYLVPDGVMEAIEGMGLYRTSPGDRQPPFPARSGAAR